MSATIRLYGCGGAGVNLVSHYLGHEKEKGCAELAPALIDTSESNLRGKDSPKESTYLVDGLDGSGKIRGENHAEIKKVIKQILVQIEPRDFNIVVFSTSGGSGSVLGPLILRELAERKIPAVAVVVGSDESVIAAENTLKTLQSLESVAKNTALPIVMSYHQNDFSEKRSTTDKSVFSTVACLSILASGQNDEMDYRDLVHWLQYTKVNGSDPQLAVLDIATDGDTFNSHIQGPISVASIYASPDQPHVSTGADYHSVGYADMSSIDGFDELHFAIGVNRLAQIGSSIKKQVNKMMEQRSARVQPDSILDGSEDTTDDDLVL